MYLSSVLQKLIIELYVCNVGTQLPDKNKFNIVNLFLKLNLSFWNSFGEWLFHTEEPLTRIERLVQSVQDSSLDRLDD